MYKKYIKRILDIIVSIIILLILFPIYLFIGICIKLIDRDNVLYIQKRTGKCGKIFNIYKFKTMKNGQTTKLGKFLKDTSLDELPQLYNVLKGDMSIVGPRPWIPDYYERFSEKQKNRNKERPGLVGLAQVNGRNKISIIEKIDYDLYYIEHISLKLDMSILLKSFAVVFKRDGIKVNEEYIRNELEKLEKINDIK